MLPTSERADTARIHGTGCRWPDLCLTSCAFVPTQVHVNSGNLLHEIAHPYPSRYKSQLRPISAYSIEAIHGK
jgi:hypothetical protein